MFDQTSILYRTFRPLEWRKLRKEHLELSMAMLEKVMLADAAHQYPTQMSGGMRQRVAIAQALVMKPSVLLLDEPFGALDEATREELQLLLLNLYQENIKATKDGDVPPNTILIVTHELNEALYVSNRIIGLSQYHADQEKGATIVYDKPAPVFHPQDERDFLMFTEQKEELRQMVFDPETKQHHADYISFWKDHQE